LLSMCCCLAVCCWRCCCPASMLASQPQPLMLDAKDDDDSSDTDEDDDPIEITRDAKCPPHWTRQNMHEDFDDRFDTKRNIVSSVQKMLDETWKDKVTRDRKGPVPTRLEVMSVQRIEDRKMWAAYLQSKQNIRKKRGSCDHIESLDGDESKGHVSTQPFACELAGGEGQMEESLNEHYFLHGTSPKGANGISESGFMINLAGSNAGTMFGKGAYFAEKSSKSDEYASTDKDSIYKGIYSLLVCRVCCGKMFRVTRSDIPAIERAMKSGKYDAVLGDREASVGTYREFVVYQERQIYPEYVVLYRRVHEDDDESS